ncbi:MAG TPA: Rieske (2Fe-2S) protein [Trebonia sp.]|nr:Rieske (2Fe-2S) protein [Trebonia sp.]
MTQEPQKDTAATRRGVLAGAGLVGIAGALSACGSAGPGSSSAAAAAPAATAPAATAPAASTPASGASALAPTSEIPVGGGKIFTAEKVVVTQPNAGEFKGFSAVCTHMGCLVNQITGGTIDCPCHGSQYSIANGSVVAGPAPSPLPAVLIKVSGDSVMLG